MHSDQMDIHNSREGAHCKSKMDNKKAQVKEMLHEKKVGSKRGSKKGSKGGSKMGTAKNSQARTPKRSHLKSTPKEKSNLKTVIHSGGKSFKKKKKKLKKKYEHIHTVSDNKDEHVKALLNIHHNSHHGDTDEQENSISLNNCNGTKYVCARLQEGDLNGVNLAPNDEEKTEDNFRTNGENFINPAWSNHNRSNDTCPSRVTIDSQSSGPARNDQVADGGEDSAGGDHNKHDNEDDADDESSQCPSEKFKDSPSENLPPPHVQEMHKINPVLEETHSRIVKHIIGQPDIKHNLSSASDVCSCSGVEEANPRTLVKNVDNTNDEVEGCRTESFAEGISQDGGGDGGAVNDGDDDAGEGGHPGEDVISGDGEEINKGNLKEPLMEASNEVDPHEAKDVWGGSTHMDALEEGEIGRETSGDYHPEEDKGEMGNPPSEERFNGLCSEERGDIDSSRGGVSGEQVSGDMSVAGDVQQQRGDENGHGKEYQGEERQVESYRPEQGTPAITPPEEKFDWRKILSYNMDTSNGGQGEMEKLNRLISFRDSAEKYLQSYINSFLNDFFLMSSYLPYLHYYDQNTYDKKEMNFLKIVTHYMDHFHCNKKMSKQIRDFKNDFINSPLNEKIKYVDEFPFLKLSEMCTDRVKGQFLKEKWVENNFLQIGLNEFGSPVAQERKQQKGEEEDNHSQVEETHDAKDSLERRPLKEPIKEEQAYLFPSVKETNPNGCRPKTYHQMGEKWNNDILCEKIISAPFLKQGEISNGDFRTKMKTMVHSLDDSGRTFIQLSDTQKKMDHASGSYRSHSKHFIRKHLNTVVRNKLFTVLHLTDAKYREKIHINNEDRHIINNISFYKNKINRLYAYLMTCTLMDHSPNFTKPHISWNGGSDVKGEPRDDLPSDITPSKSDSLRSSSTEIHTKNELQEKDSGSPNSWKTVYNLIKISDEFVKNNASTQKNKIPRNCSRESLSKDMDILTRIILQDGAYISAPRVVGQNGKGSYISTLSNKAKRLSSYPVECGVEEWAIHNGKGALEVLADGATCFPHVTSKLDEAGNETLDKSEEVRGGGDLQCGPRERRGKRRTSGLSEGDQVNHSVQNRLEQRPEARGNLQLPVKKKKTDDSKFQLSPDLQFIYDAYNNGEQIIVVHNKKQGLHNLDKCTKITRVSKRSLFHANDLGQNGGGPAKGIPSTVYKSQMGYAKNTNGANLPISNSSHMAYSYYAQSPYDNNMAFMRNDLFRQRNGEGTDRGYSKGSLGGTNGTHIINSNHNMLMNYTIEHLSKLDNVQNRINCVDSNNILVNNSSVEFTKCTNLTNAFNPQYVPGALNYMNGINSSVHNYSKGNLKGISYCMNRNNVSNYLTVSNNCLNQFDNFSHNMYNQMGNTNPFLYEQMQRESNTLMNQNGYPHFALTNNYFSHATNSFTQNGQDGGNNCGSYYQPHENMSYTNQGQQNVANNVDRGTVHIDASKQMQQPCVDLPNRTSDNHFAGVTQDGTDSANPQHKPSSEHMVEKDNNEDAMGVVNQLEGKQQGYLNDVSQDLNCTHTGSTTSGECKGGDDHREVNEKSYPPKEINELLGDGSKHVVNTDVGGKNHQQCDGNEPNGDEQASNITETGEDHLKRDVKKSSDYNDYIHDKLEVEKESPLNSNNNSSQNSGPDTGGSAPGVEDAGEGKEEGDNCPSTEGTNSHVDTYPEGTINGDTGVRSVDGDKHDGSASPNATDTDPHIDSAYHPSNNVTPPLQKKNHSHEDNTTSEQVADHPNTSSNNDEHACSTKVQHVINTSKGVKDPVHNTHLVNNDIGYFNMKNQPPNNNHCGSIANLDMGAPLVEANRDTSYYGGSSPFGGNGEEKSININKTHSFFNENEMGAPMDDAHIRDSVMNGMGGSSPLNSRSTGIDINKSNHMNSIVVSINNTGNETKYKMTEEMVNRMRQADAYQPPYGHYQLSDPDTSMANLYKQFSVNGIMPPPSYHNGRNNNMKNYQSAEMRNNINVHNYNMKKNDNVEMTNEYLSMSPPVNNFPTPYGYLYNYNMGNYFVNGVNWVGLENRTSDRPVRNNVNFTNYNGMFNEYCDGDEEEWDAQQEGSHQGDPQQDSSHQEDDDRSGGSFPSSSNLKKRDKMQKEKKNANMNTNKPQPFGLSASKKKRLGNNGPPTAEKLSELLHEKNLSVPQIAAIYGVHRTTVARWCHNRNVIQKSSSYQGRKKSSSTVGAEYT
ncbi:hypothetical protein AK88_03979 [Plasmodium fragile]|uniref:Uncharacterized protein n=1 Tax=Plasmodium fragile TaxID=5857 RepID=A0A0D9QKT8_PLAFR|nr:uncharacterized protein AK88_03979 [Plasmodium fragile]KJP86346.1 hypothetical protein AK88_03979 [Plasmodium fragile]